MRTLQDLLPQLARLQQREAIRWSDGFRTSVSTYTDLCGTIGAAVSYFDEKTVRKGDRILIYAENRMEWVAVFWACVATGAVAVPVDFRFSQDVVRRIQSESKARLKIDGTELDRIAALPRRPQFSIADATPDDIVEIVYTSGTTSEPKGVTHRHRHICANLRPFQAEINKYKRWARPLQPIRILDLLPLSHMFGQALGIHIPPLLGGAAMFTSELHPGRFMEMVRENRVTTVVAVPQMLNNFKNEVERHFQIPVASAPGLLARIWRNRDIHRALGWRFWAFVAGGATVDLELE